MIKEEDSSKNSYLTYFNYIQALALSFPTEKSLSKALEAITSSKSFSSIRVKKLQNYDDLKKWLYLAWNTEMLLHSNLSVPEMVNLMNLWAPVQLYYSLFSGVHAFFAVQNNNFIPTHAALLKAIANASLLRRNLFLPTWQLICVRKGLSVNFVGTPRGVSIGDISNLSKVTEQNCWDYIGKFLKTTSGRVIDERVAQWKKEYKKQRIPAKEKNKFEAKISFLDFLWRIRTRCNYEDGGDFVFGGSQQFALLLHQAILSICHSALLNLELLVAKYIDFRAYSDIVNSFSDNHRASSLLSTNNQLVPSKKRIEIIKTFL